MKRSFLVLTLVTITTVAFSQSKSSGGILGGVKDVLNKAKGKTGTTSLTNDEIVAGLKESACADKLINETNAEIKRYFTETLLGLFFLVYSLAITEEISLGDQALFGVAIDSDQ